MSKEKLDLLSRHCTQLSEHFDSVQIIATSYDGEATRLMVSGRGNWYARLESARAWIRDEIEEGLVEDDEED